jgi:hypothetical protein
MTSFPVGTLLNYNQTTNITNKLIELFQKWDYIEEIYIVKG